MSVVDVFRERHPNHESLPLFGEPVCLPDGSEVALFDATNAELPGLIIYTLLGANGDRGSSIGTIFEPFVSRAADGDLRRGAVILASERVKRITRTSLQE